MATIPATPRTTPRSVRTLRSGRLRMSRRILMNRVLTCLDRRSRDRPPCGAPVTDDLAVAHCDNARGTSSHLLIVGHDDYRRTLVPQRFQYLGDGLSVAGVEVAGRL